jgi:hypothetical protein
MNIGLAMFVRVLHYRSDEHNRFLRQSLDETNHIFRHFVCLNAQDSLEFLVALTEDHKC